MKLPRIDPLAMARGAHDAAASVVALARAGFIRPIGVGTIAEVVPRVLREGARPHMVYGLHALESPHRVALVHDGRATTWAMLLERVNRLANHLLSIGVLPGDAVGVMLPNRPEFIEAQAASLAIGASAVFLNPRAPAAAAREILARVGPRVLLTNRTDLGGEVPALVVGEEYERALREAPAHEPERPRDAEGRVVVFTSGTSGRPKGAVRSFQSGSLGTLAGLLRVIPLRRDDVHLVAAPLYHTTGSGFLTIAQVLGNPTVLLERFSPEAFCRTVETWRVTTTAVVPTMLHELTRFPDASRYDLSSLRAVVCTGSALRAPARNAARALLGDVVYDLYGSTEMAWVSVATPQDQRRKPGSVGRPVPGTSVRILAPDGRPAPAGEAGEIWASNALTMREYLGDPGLTGERIRDGYVSVRDIGYVDAEGYLHVIDRADDMIISGGVNVYPAETEGAILAHPHVAEVAVVGIPDEKWGQRVVAAAVTVVPEPEPDLMSWCKERLPAAAVPKEIRFLDRLPRNDVGKVVKLEIAAAWDARPANDER